MVGTRAMGMEEDTQVGALAATLAEGATEGILVEVTGGTLVVVMVEGTQVVVGIADMVAVIAFMEEVVKDAAVMLTRTVRRKLNPRQETKESFM